MDEYQTRFSLENKNNTNTPAISLKFMLDYKSTNSTIQYRNIPDLFAGDDYDFFFLLPAAIYGKLVSARCQNIGRDRQRCHGVINTRLSKSNGSFIHQAGRSTRRCHSESEIPRWSRKGWMVHVGADKRYAAARCCDSDELSEIRHLSLSTPGVKN